MHASKRTGLRTLGSRTRRGFTLIELLVVVAVIGMLTAILLPTLSRAREQASSVRCLAYIRELGRGMVTYHVEYGNYPVHQWRVSEEIRIRWFDALASSLGEVNVQEEFDEDGNRVRKGRPDVRSCPSTPDWVVGRNNSYGYNYKYVGSARENVSPDNPYRPWETFPVKDMPVPSKTIAFADCDGTGWAYEWTDNGGGANRDHLGNHGYTLDPTYIPLRSEETLSGGTPEKYAWHEYRTYLSDRHQGRSNAIFVDGHGSAIEPLAAYEDNALWNGLGFDPGCDPATPDFDLDPHVDYKYDPSSGQQWRDY